jgi:hypothetical protein
MDLKIFKPEFGNPNHIRVVELMGSLNEKRKKLQFQRTNAKGVNKTESEIAEIEKQINFLLK